MADMAGMKMAPQGPMLCGEGHCDMATQMTHNMQAGMMRQAVTAGSNMAMSKPMDGNPKNMG